MEAIELILKISQAGSTFLLALAVFGFLTGRVVSRWQYDQCELRGTVWKDLYEREKALLEKTLSIADRTTAKSEGT